MAGVIQFPAPVTNTSSESTNDAKTATNTPTIYELFPTTVAPIRGITLVGNANTTSTALTLKIEIMTGVGGAEVRRAYAFLTLIAADVDGCSFCLPVKINLPAGTRVAWRTSTDTGTVNVAFGVTVEEG